MHKSKTQRIVIFLFAVTSIATSILMTSCGKDDEPTIDNVYRYWADQSDSYIQLPDDGFTFELKRMNRESSSLYIYYTLTNIAEDSDVEFFGSDTQANAVDDMGNSYYLVVPNSGSELGKVYSDKGMQEWIAGRMYGVYGNNKTVRINHGETVEGIVYIKGLSSSATKISLGFFAKRTNKNYGKTQVFQEAYWYKFHNLILPDGDQTSYKRLQ